MLSLKRIGDEVYCGEKKLTIVKQSSKGENKEVVKVDGLDGSNGVKYISLKKFVEGENIFNDIDLVKREIAPKYELTPDEQKEVDEYTHQIEEYQSKIDSIIEIAKQRFVPPTKSSKKSPQQSLEKIVEKMGKEKAIEYLKSLLGEKIGE